MRREATGHLEFPSRTDAPATQDVQIGDVDPDRETARGVELFNPPNLRDRAVRGLAAVDIESTSGEISAAITATAEPDNSVTKVAARHSDPRTAQAMSSAMTSAFIQQRQATATTSSRRPSAGSKSSTTR